MQTVRFKVFSLRIKRFFFFPFDFFFFFFFFFSYCKATKTTHPFIGAGRGEILLKSLAHRILGTLDSGAAVIVDVVGPAELALIRVWKARIVFRRAGQLAGRNVCCGCVACFRHSCFKLRKLLNVDSFSAAMAANLYYDDVVRENKRKKKKKRIDFNMFSF
jgi:hypothetical protein